MDFKTCNLCTHYDGVVIKHSKHCPKYGQLNKDQPKYEDTKLLCNTFNDENRDKKYRTWCLVSFFVIYIVLLYLYYL
jgi:hypothetical protein